MLGGCKGEQKCWYIHDNGDVCVWFKENWRRTGPSADTKAEAEHHDVKITTTDLGELGWRSFAAQSSAAGRRRRRRPNLDALDDYAQAMEMFAWVAGGTMSLMVEPTEGDAKCPDNLVQPIREGASHEALIESARRAVRVCTDTWALARFQSALLPGGRSSRRAQRAH